MIAKLYALFYSDLLGYAAAMTGERHWAEDIVQDVFLRALENAALLDTLTERKCRAWLYKTAHNRFHQRRHTPQRRNCAQERKKALYQRGSYT